MTSPRTLSRSQRRRDFGVTFLDHLFHAPPSCLARVSAPTMDQACHCAAAGELCGGADRWSAAKACVELVIERVQPTATSAAYWKPPHHLANCRRGVFDRPPDLLVTDVGIAARCEFAGPRPYTAGPRTCFAWSGVISAWT